MATSHDTSTPPLEDRIAAELGELDIEQLQQLCRLLNVRVDNHATLVHMRRELLRRMTMVSSIDDAPMQDLLQWAGSMAGAKPTPVRVIAHIAACTRTDYFRLPEPALRRLAAIRGVKVSEQMDAGQIVDALKRSEGLMGILRRKKRELIGSLLGGLFEQAAGVPDSDTQTSTNGNDQLKKKIVDEGFTRGLSSQLRGMADSYVSTKLDEIEQRIDRKLDQIDKRLSEWRDAEVRNRLRMLKITLVFSVVIAVVSLGYSVVRHYVLTHDGTTGQQTLTTDDDSTPTITTENDGRQHTQP